MPSTSPPTYLVLQGYQGSGPEHWQMQWCGVLEGTKIVQQNWNRPDKSRWVTNLDTAIRACAQPPVLIAHSLGVTCVALWAAHHLLPVRAAFLVAPPDLQNEAVPAACRVMGPTALAPLPFASLVVGSESDPYSALERTYRLAKSWRSDFANIGAQGHINVASGHGPWPQGLQLMMHFIEGR